MNTVADIVTKVRSKNAGPFWLTVDVFCGTPQAYQQIVQSLSTDRVAAAFQVDVDTIKRFDIDTLNVVKFSLPRPVIQGDITDRDMHGAGWAPLVAELSLN
ncbi:DUF4387 domain-containing protein [Loktanella sp. F6476L]|uniref:DUF4387 family protein n=1 Tax=Loktanella sp. F6476L TaxID=2926405 RepID=UPI001FF28B5C|nr:DUF4387 family protein [Loktanella sp. F6476L]MCK0119347.1 DUF4387 domain-containing protein [Loktanella sp. F6476L]UWR00671.1 DUF4387 domain-containing protein [Rhodobacteraceae bacterium S2214]